MKKIFLLLLLSNSLFSQTLFNDSTKGPIKREFDFFSAEVVKSDGSTLDISIETSISFKSFGIVNEQINTQIVEQIRELWIKSSVDVYNFLLGWDAFRCDEVSPFQNLPVLPLKGTRYFLKDEQKSGPFKGTQQIFEIFINGKTVKLVVHFQRTEDTELEITIIKQNGTYITFYNLP